MMIDIKTYTVLKRGILRAISRRINELLSKPLDANMSISFLLTDLVYLRYVAEYGYIDEIKVKGSLPKDPEIRGIYLVEDYTVIVEVSSKNDMNTLSLTIKYMSPEQLYEYDSDAYMKIHEVLDNIVLVYDRANRMWKWTQTILDMILDHPDTVNEWKISKQDMKRMLAMVNKHLDELKKEIEEADEKLDGLELLAG